MKMYVQDQNMIQWNEEFVVRKILFWIYYWINKIVLMSGINVIFFKENKLSSHMAQTIEHNSSSNHKIWSYD